MVWALLASVGLSIVLAAVLVMMSRRRRRQVERCYGTFRCKVRVHAGAVAGLSPEWPRRAYRGRWVHDVLLVHRGFFFARTTDLAVRSVDGEVKRVPSTKRIGPLPVMMPLTLDSGEVVHVLAAGADATLLAGPFVVAVLGRASDRSTP
jgi:hypothetical protein